MVFTDSLNQVVLAITNAFGDGAYHGSKFIYCPCDYVLRGGTEVAAPQTNAWLLHSERMPLTLLPRGKQMVAYREDFGIKAETANWGSTKVSVRPAGSGTTERTYELSMHLSQILGGRYLPPLPAETTNVFQRIERQLVEIRAGRMTPLAPTPDTRSDYYRCFWTDMTIEAMHDRRNWDKMVQAWKELQEGHSQHLQPTPR